MTDFLLTAQNLNFAYGGSQILRNVSLNVKAGECVALIGPNGAGKTTLLHCLAGARQPSSGQISLAGQPITNLSIEARANLGLGRGFQTAAVFATLTARQQLHLAAPKAQRLIDSVLQASGLSEKADTPAANLAYADAKRLDLALAAVQAPRVLLLDEPAAGLSSSERASVMQWIAKLAAQGCAVIFTEHHLDAVFSTAQRVVVLVRGEVIANDAPQRVANNPQVKAQYLGAAAIKI